MYEYLFQILFISAQQFFGLPTLRVTKPTTNLLRKTLSNATNKSLSFPLYHYQTTIHQIMFIRINGDLFGSIRIRHGPNADFNFALEGAFFAGTGIRTHVNPWTNKKCGAVS